MSALSRLSAVLLSLLAVCAAQAEVRVVPKIASVAVGGASVDEAAAQFDRLLASTFSTVEVRFEAQYGLRFYPGWCQVTNAVVEATVIGALPQWAGAATADAAARQRWDALTADVRGRVAGMQRDSRTAAQEMDRLIEAMPSQRDCDAAKAEAGRIIETVKTRLLGSR
jgi:predicted secreted Zn-dependent protease